MNRGFTLIELLVVIGIIGILASLILPGLLSVASDANEAAVKTELHGFSVAVHTLFKDYYELIPSGEDYGPRNDEEKKTGVGDDRGNSKFFLLFQGKNEKGQTVCRMLQPLEKKRYKPSPHDDSGKRMVFLDYFNNPYIFRYPGRVNEGGCDLYSMGINGIDDKGEGDDIMMTFNAY